MTFQVYTRYTGTHNLILTWLLEVCRKKESSKGKSKHKASPDMKQLGMQQPETSKCQTVQNLKVGTATALQQIQHFKSWSTAQVWGQKNVIKVKARPGYGGNVIICCSDHTSYSHTGMLQRPHDCIYLCIIYTIYLSHVSHYAICLDWHVV